MNGVGMVLVLVRKERKGKERKGKERKGKERKGKERRGTGQWYKCKWIMDNEWIMARFGG